MNMFKWLEEQIFTGKVLHDYGPIYKKGVAVAGETHTLLLCRRGGKDWITIRHSFRAALSFSVSYTRIPAEMAEALAEKFVDIAARRGSTHHSLSR